MLYSLSVRVQCWSCVPLFLQCTDAYYYLGVCYETGAIDEQPDDVKAAHYYSLGAENGHPDAQYNLAVFYEEGYGKYGFVYVEPNIC